MHPLFRQADELSREVIGAAIEVHKSKGPGLLESIYEWCLIKELELRGHSVCSQNQVVVKYKQFKKEESLQFDVMVDDCLLVEVKAVERVLPIHKAQLLSYMKLLGVPLGLLLNFHSMKLTDGVSRMIIPQANMT